MFTCTAGWVALQQQQCQPCASASGLYARSCLHHPYCSAVDCTKQVASPLELPQQQRHTFFLRRWNVSSRASLSWYRSRLKLKADRTRRTCCFWEGQLLLAVPPPMACCPACAAGFAAAGEALDESCATASSSHLLVSTTQPAGQATRSQDC